MSRQAGLYKIDWQELAWDNGFKGNDKAMLIHFHHTKRLSQAKIGLILNLCDATISKRMRLLQIEVIRVPSNLPSYVPRLPKG